MTDHLPPVVTLDTEEGIPLPQTAALIDQLTREYGTEYTQMLARAVESANHNNQTRYKNQLNTAIGILSRAGGDRPKALAIGHVGSFLTTISADIQSFTGVKPPTSEHLTSIFESMRAAGWETPTL